MSKTAVLLSHQLFPQQTAELREVFHADSIVYLPPELQQGWSAVDPTDEVAACAFNTEILQWLQDNFCQGDCCVVQGEYGITFQIVDYCLERGIIPLYSATRREVVESREGDTAKTSRVFRHVCFRRYKKFIKGEVAC